MLPPVDSDRSETVEQRLSSSGRAFVLLLTATLTVIGTLYVARMIALFPLEHDLTAENSAGDDWLT